MIKSMIVQNTPMFSVVLCLVVFYSFAGIPGNTINAALIDAASCEQADVQTAITAALPEDTVLVPAGNCTWNSVLTIAKGIYLIGAGDGVTNITCTSSDTYIITYQPSDLSANHSFRVSGFTFDMDDKSYGIRLDASRSSELTIQTKVRIDHNTFKNSSGQAIWNNGMRGVIDNNMFIGIDYPLRHPSCYGHGDHWWDNWDGIIYGAADNNMYLEDNTFTGVGDCIMDCQYANRYVLRYNTVTMDDEAYPLLDMHGNQGEGYMYACFGGEVYGNDITMARGQILDQRGGKAVVFYNNINGTCGGIKIREEYADSLNPSTNPQPQHVSDSYNWNNRVNYTGSAFVGYEPIGPSGTATNGGNNYLEDSSANFAPGYGSPSRYGLEIIGGTGAGQSRLIINVTSIRLTVALNWDTNPDATSQYHIIADCCEAIAEDSEFFNFVSSGFDGTTGVGCGTYASRPLTCTKGVGYWATDQSCSDLTGMVGANPAFPISGTLYKCTAINTWTPYYTPFTYPHPLRTNDAEYEIIVNVYPNPCRVFQGENSVTFFGDLSIGDNIKVFDMSGKTVHDSGELSEATYEWSVSDITSGVYFYVVNSSDGQRQTSGKIALIR
ncbi:T9SS type A sorting domain-containing protein [candidate division WOR-3 bacterium]|nr:T9SS type A sorting domain-containing protein [candidate division WOR-3 bacterium]